MEQQANNKVTIIGTISESFKLSHTLYTDNFETEIYATTLEVMRHSGCIDRIPIEVKGTKAIMKSFKIGTKVLVEGEIRTYNIESHLKVIIFVKRITEVSGEQDKNEIEMIGYICKPPIFRTTPFGRKICDVIIAIPKKQGRSFYVPCILWGRNAEYVANLEVGTRLNLEGRMQSRDYRKIIDGESVKKTVLEMSGSMVGLI